MKNNLDQIEPFAGFEKSTNRLPMADPGGGFLPDPVQQVKTAYTTAVAVQRPRSMSRVQNNVLHEASLAGASFYYRWSVTAKDGGKKFIQGPSIDMAMCLVRNYGNCVTDIEILQETATHYVFKGSVIDLETGFTCPRLFRQRKSQTLGKFNKDRQEDITFQIGQSKAIRNAIVHAMPSWLIDKAIETARAAEIQSIDPETMANARAGCIDFFAGYGIDVGRLELSIGSASDLWTKADIEALRANATALKEGRVSPDDLFPQDDEKQTKLHNYWSADIWHNLKGPGVRHQAELHKDTFKNQPKELRQAFEDKWDRCENIGPFPFDIDGNWIEPSETTQEKEGF